MQAANFTSDFYDGGASPELQELLSDEEVFSLVSLAVEVISELHHLDVLMPDMPPLPLSAEMWRRYALDKAAWEADIEALCDSNEEVDDTVAKVAAAQAANPEFAENCALLARRYERLIARLFDQDQCAELALHLAESHIGRTYACVGRALGWFAAPSPATTLFTQIHQGRLWPQT